MNRWQRLGMLIVIVLLTAGCAIPLVGGENIATPRHTYLLEWTPVTATASSSSATQSLLITPPRARPPYSSSDMLYMSSEHELNAFAYHRWADSPAHMLEPLLILSAENSGLFRLVVPAGNQVITDLRLDTWMLHLRQVFAPGECHLELAIRVELNDVATARPLGTQLFSYREPCEQASPQGGMTTANRIVGRFLQELQTALAGMLPR